MKSLIEDALANNYYIHVFIDEVWLNIVKQWPQSLMQKFETIYLQTQEDCQKIWTL